MVLVDADGIDAVLLDFQRSRSCGRQIDRCFIGSGHGGTFQEEPLQPILPHWPSANVTASSGMHYKLGAVFERPTSALDHRLQNL